MDFLFLIALGQTTAEAVTPSLAVVGFVEEIFPPRYVGTTKIAHYLSIHVQRKTAGPPQQVHA
jgi:hypothetical protein